MSDVTEFVKNYEDLSTDAGYQFEFKCDRCGIGYRTSFVASATGTINNVLDAASGIFGGVFGKAASVGHKVHSAQYERVKEEELKKAIDKVRPNFIQCPRCQSWVCRKACWNNKKGLCKKCAPDLGVEMSAAQASKSVEEVWAHAAMAEEDKKLDTEKWRKNIKASCPKCEAPLETNAKFCPECGANLKPDATCKKCGAKLTENAKFCVECGEKTN